MLHSSRVRMIDLWASPRALLVLQGHKAYRTRETIERNRLTPFLDSYIVNKVQCQTCKTYTILHYKDSLSWHDVEHFKPAMSHMK